MSAGTAAATRTALPAPEIPLGSRIIFCADAFHAIRCDRPYRAGRSAARRWPRSSAAPAPSSTRRSPRRSSRWSGSAAPAARHALAPATLRPAHVPCDRRRRVGASPAPDCSGDPGTSPPSLRADPAAGVRHRRVPDGAPGRLVASLRSAGPDSVPGRASCTPGLPGRRHRGARGRQPGRGEGTGGNRRRRDRRSGSEASKAHGKAGGALGRVALRRPLVLLASSAGAAHSSSGHGKGGSAAGGQSSAGDHSSGGRSPERRAEARELARHAGSSGSSARNGISGEAPAQRRRRRRLSRQVAATAARAPARP